MASMDTDSDLAAILAGLERGPPVRMPPAPLGVRVRTSPALRMALPTPAVVRRAERKGQRVWRTREGTREHARRTMRAIVAGTEREGELERLAREHVIETEAWKALFWQPWPIPQVDPSSRRLLQSECDGRRGVVLSACHLGPYFRKSATLVSLGIEPCVVAGDWFFSEPSHDYWGRRLARWRKGVPDVPLVRPRGSFSVLRTVLEHGGTALVYFDMPGRRETTFLGKPVMLVDGTSRLAVEADALIVPLRSRRDGHTIRLEAHEPLDPRSFADSEELHTELARVHERLILENPAAMSDPAEYGWEATATRWRRAASHGTDVAARS